MTDRFSTFDAAYVLGALSDDDRIAYEEHLTECPECSRAVAALSGLPGALSQIPRPGQTPEPPGKLLPTVLARARKERRRRFGVTVGAFVLAAAAAFALPSVLSARGTAFSQIGSQHLAEADATLSSESTGTRIDMNCTYHGGYAGNYLLVAVSKDGTVLQLATWRAMPSDTARISVNTGWSKEAIQDLEVRTVSGKPLLRWSI